MTIAVNHGYAMTSNPEARRAWDARHQARSTQTAAEYRATIGRLAARFPGAVTRLEN